LSSLKTADLYGTISTVDSTGNAPKSSNTQHVCHIITDEVYTNLVQISTKEATDIKSNKNSPKQLTPVTIMVVDTISSVKLRILLKVLLDSGSTTTMIWSVLQKQDGIIKCQVWYLPSWENQETYLIPGY
jgi:hypothetical protein